jgi:hypothetical protein
LGSLNYESPTGRAYACQTFFKIRHVALHPPQDRRMSQQDAALGHHLDEVTGTELKRQVPPHAQHDYLLVKMPPFEEILCRGRFRHPGRYGSASVFSSLHQNPPSRLHSRRAVAPLAAGCLADSAPGRCYAQPPNKNRGTGRKSGRALKARARCPRCKSARAADRTGKTSFPCTCSNSALVVFSRFTLPAALSGPGGCADTFSKCQFRLTALRQRSIQRSVDFLMALGAWLLFLHFRSVA